MQEDIKRRDLPRAALLNLIVRNTRILSIPLLDLIPMDAYEVGSDRPDVRSLQSHIGI